MSGGKQAVASTEHLIRSEVEGSCQVTPMWGKMERFEIRKKKA